MSIQFLKEHTQKIPVGSPLRSKFDAALAEIDAVQSELEGLKEGSQPKRKARKSFVPVEDVEPQEDFSEPTEPTVA